MISFLISKRDGRSQSQLHISFYPIFFLKKTFTWGGCEPNKTGKRKVLRKKLRKMLFPFKSWLGGKKKISHFKMGSRSAGEGKSPPESGAPDSLQQKKRKEKKGKVRPLALLLIANHPCLSCAFSNLNLSWTRKRSKKVVGIYAHKQKAWKQGKRQSYKKTVRNEREEKKVQK